MPKSPAAKTQKQKNARQPSGLNFPRSRQTIAKTIRPHRNDKSEWGKSAPQNIGWRGNTNLEEECWVEGEHKSQLPGNSEKD